MHDLSFFRNHLEAIQGRLASRGFTLDVEAFQELDHRRRQCVTESEQLKAERNQAIPSPIGAKGGAVTLNIWRSRFHQTSPQRKFNLTKCATGTYSGVRRLNCLLAIQARRDYRK